MVRHPSPGMGRAGIPRCRAGVVSLGSALVGVSGLSWIALLSGQLSWPGPTYRDPYLSGIALGVLALVGLVVFILAGFVGKSQAESAAMRIEDRTAYAGAPPPMGGGRAPPSPPQPHLGQGGGRGPPPPPPPTRGFP